MRIYFLATFYPEFNLLNIRMIPDSLVDLVMRNFAFLLMGAVRDAKETTQSWQYKDRYLDPQNKYYELLRRRINESVPTEAPRLPNTDSTRKVWDSISWKSGTGTEWVVGMKVRRGQHWCYGEEDMRCPFDSLPELLTEIIFSINWALFISELPEKCFLESHFGCCSYPALGGVT